jgi:hypothetical protein
MVIVLYIYVAGALLVALRLFRHMLFKLDRYDWHYGKGHILGSFVLSVVLWPLIVIKPRNLIDPTKLFEGTFSSAARMRDQLWENPPPCGSVIRYRQEYEFYGFHETYGEFLFNAADVEQTLRTRIRDSPNLRKYDEGAILNWVKHRNDEVTEPTDVPSAWSRFQYTANDLARGGCAKVRCLKCDIELATEQLMISDDHGKPGWNYYRLTCPCGHPLLVVQGLHLLMKDDT